MIYFNSFRRTMLSINSHKSRKSHNSHDANHDDTWGTYANLCDIYDGI